MHDDIEKILLHESTILRRLDELAAQITSDYRGRDLTIIALLNGSIVFLSDLLRRVPLPLQIDCLSVSSYHGVKSTGQVTFRQANLPDVAGRHVLVVDDIFDSGLTLAAVLERLQKEKGILSLRTCVLLSKRTDRKISLQPDYVAFEIPNEFVVGYGLDYMEHYRNLPFIGVLKPEAIERWKKPA